MLTEKQIELLKQPLDMSRIAHRSQGGKQLSYIEGYDAIDKANEILGFGSWGYDIISLTPGTGSNKDGEVKNFYTAILKLTVEGCHPVTDVGVGIVAGNSPESHETAIKGAVTDAMKRALRTFGNQFGNSLYDKDSPVTNSQPARAAARPVPAQPVKTNVPVPLKPEKACVKCDGPSIYRAGEKDGKAWQGYFCQAKDCGHKEWLHLKQG